MQTSKSGKTIVVNQGSSSNIGKDDYGILLNKHIEATNYGPKTTYRPVAKLKAVKVYLNTSVWIIYRSFNSSAIYKDAKLLLFSETALLEGRNNLKIKKSRIVGHKGKITSQLKNSLKEDELELSKKSHEYVEIQEVHGKEKHYDSDIELVDLDLWEDKTASNEYEAKGFYKSPHAAEFSDRKRVQTFEKMVAAFVKKHIDPKFTLERIAYLNENTLEASGRVLTPSYYKNLQKDRADQRKREELIVKEVLKKGESWSDGYSDEELSEILYNIGAVKERKRRATIVAHRYDGQIYGSFGLNLLNNENLEDTDNTEQSKYDLEFSYESYFMKDLDGLNHISVEASLRRANDAFSTGTYNATSTETSLAIHVNWYPYSVPNIFNSNIFYVGMTLRYGVSRLAIDSLGEEGDYQVTTMPGLRTGLKYNFPNGYGARFTVGVENIQFSRTIKTDDVGELPDEDSLLEAKLGFGISKFF